MLNLAAKPITLRLSPRHQSRECPTPTRRSGCTHSRAMTPCRSTKDDANNRKGTLQAPDLSSLAQTSDQVKLFDAPLVCPTSGCETVLNSPYASLFGIPLSLLGMFAYGTVAALSLKCNSVAKPGQASELIMPWNKALMAGVTLLASCSAVLVYLLQTEFNGTPCAYCYLSAGLSFSLLVTMLFGMDPRQLKQAAGPSVGVLASTVVALYFGFGGFGGSTAEDFELPYTKPEVTSDSSKQAIELARRLKAAGARMYGAFWCTHCFDQKQTFGKQAMADFPYVECYPDGWRRGVKEAPACEAVKVKAFPTWVIGGDFSEGELTLEEIEQKLANVTASKAI